MFGIPSGWELLVLAVVVAALFMPKRLAGMAKSLGKAKGAYDEGMKTGRDAKKNLTDSFFSSSEETEGSARDEVVEIDPDEG